MKALSKLISLKKIMESLNDPLNDRAVKSVKAPPHRPLAPELMYPNPSNY
jgi:hypothetical protein